MPPHTTTTTTVNTTPAASHGNNNDDNDGGGRDNADTGGRDAWSLVIAAQHGDGAAFAQLYRLHVEQVRGFLRRRVPGDPHLVDDLTSETFLRALRGLNTLTHHHGTPAGWLTTIARNILFDHFKASARRRVHVIDLGEYELAEAAPGPEEDVITRDTARRVALSVRAVLAQLTPPQRRCLWLRYVHGLSTSDTAHVMRLSVPTYKGLQQRATDRLAQLLGATKPAHRTRPQ